MDTKIFLEAEVLLVEYLQEDPRPTFVVKLCTNSAPTNHQLQLVFSNEALHKADDRFDLLKACSGDASSAEDLDAQRIAFISWANDDLASETYQYRGITWTAVTLHRRWRIVSSDTLPQGTPRQHDADGVLQHDHSAARGQVNGETLETSNFRNDQSSKITKPSSSSTRIIEASKLIQSLGSKPSEHQRYVQTFDWGSTPLGPISEWPQTLFDAVPYILCNPEPCCILWGRDRTMIYNESYIELIKGFHPSAMGSQAEAIFGPVWQPFEALCQTVERTEQPIRQENVRVPVDRSNGVEEIFFTYYIVPIMDADDVAGGVMYQVTEVTDVVVAQRRMQTLLSMVEGTALLTSLADFWHGLFTSIQNCSADLPFMAAYSTRRVNFSSNLDDDSASSTSEDDTWHLEGSVGFSQTFLEAHETLALSRLTGFGPAIKLALSHPGPLLVDKGDGIIAAECFPTCSDGVTTMSSSQILVCQLHLSLSRTSAVLILALNPLRPYDKIYQGFVSLLSRQIEDAATSVYLLEKEKHHFRQTVEQAEHQKKWLSEQLLLQTREAQESELRFLNFAKQAPVGVYILGPEGEIKFCNDAWYRQTGVSVGSKDPVPWRAHVHPDDLEAVDHQWQLLKQGHVQAGFDWRALQTPRTGNDNQDIKYMQSSAFPELADDGSMKSVTGILLDLSLNKAHEHAVAEQLASALEAKRVQENFMDMVSHEMRNPLNAILQCAEEAAQTFKESTSSHVSGNDFSIIAKQVLEAIDTILYCGQHQKQIIDDVLTVSKLDSNLLTLSPISIKPTAVIEQTVKVFTSEIRALAIDVDWKLDPDGSFDSDTAVFIDQSRVLQILINLIGNAIKFMKDRPLRKLDISVSITTTRPYDPTVHYVPSGKKREDSTTKAEWGEGEVVFIQFSVTDTGPGLTPEQMKILFTRFTQASPRTHGQYGGSGLGLFISRELAELHGGEIGLASELHSGSTFAFYVKGRINVSHTSGTVRQTNDPISSAHRRVSLSRMSNVADPSNITILIVEDNLVNQKVLNRQLSKLGFHTKIANHGEEALSVLQCSQWWHDKQKQSINLSIILCDLEMPVMDGMTCIRCIRQWQESGLLEENIPVVAVTGNARPEQIKAAREAGFDDVVCKPYSVPDLVPVVSRLVQACNDKKATTMRPSIC